MHPLMRCVGLIDYSPHVHFDREFQYWYTCIRIYLYSCMYKKAPESILKTEVNNTHTNAEMLTWVCTVPVLDTNTSVKLVSGAAHASQLIHFSSVPCTTIYFRNPLGPGFPALHSTSSAELIQTRFSRSLFYSQYTENRGWIISVVDNQCRITCIHKRIIDHHHGSWIS